jgi:hypothetical protein
LASAFSAKVAPVSGPARTPARRQPEHLDVRRRGGQHPAHLDTLPGFAVARTTLIAAVTA